MVFPSRLAGLLQAFAGERRPWVSSRSGRVDPKPETRAPERAVRGVTLASNESYSRRCFAFDGGFLDGSATRTVDAEGSLANVGPPRDRPMGNLMITNAFLLVFVIAFMGCVLSTPIVPRLAAWAGAIDRPDQFRRIHKGATPRMGGLGLAVGLGAGLLPVALGGLAHDWPGARNGGRGNGRSLSRR